MVHIRYALMSVLAGAAAAHEQWSASDNVFQIGQGLLPGNMSDTDWHHFHGHAHWEHMKAAIIGSHHCHRKCGKDPECHHECPKPWAPLYKACSELPAIKACLEQCKDADCEKCPRFSVEWCNKKLAEHPEEMFRKSQAMCARLEQVHACQASCQRGDFECHQRCPEVLKMHQHGKHGWHHHGDAEEDNHHHHKEDDWPDQQDEATQLPTVDREPQAPDAQATESPIVKYFSI